MLCGVHGQVENCSKLKILRAFVFREFPDLGDERFVKVTRVSPHVGVGINGHRQKGERTQDEGFEHSFFLICRCIPEALPPLPASTFPNFQELNLFANSILLALEEALNCSGNNQGESIYKSAGVKILSFWYVLQDTYQSVYKVIILIG